MNMSHTRRCKALNGSQLKPEERQEDDMEVNKIPSAGESAVIAASVQQKERFENKQLKAADSAVRSKDVVFFSPVIRIDTKTSTAILEYRDSETGEVERQIPTREQVESYQKPQVSQPAPVAESVPQQVVSPAAPAVKESAPVEKAPEKPVVAEVKAPPVKVDEKA